MFETKNMRRQETYINMKIRRCEERICESEQAIADGRIPTELGIKIKEESIKEDKKLLKKLNDSLNKLKQENKKS